MRQFLSSRRTMILLILAAFCASIIVAFIFFKNEDRNSTENGGDQLFFALKIEMGEHLIARPNLLGESGRRLTLKMVDPEQPDRLNLALKMLPELSTDGSGYDISFSIQMPDLAPEPEDIALHMSHGEEKRFLLTLGRIPITMTMTLLRVDSPEFEAWKELVQKDAAEQAT